MKNKALKSLLESYSESTKRTRSVFLIINLSSLLLLIAFFNYNFSWLRHQKKFYEKNIHSEIVEKEEIVSQLNAKRNNESKIRVNEIKHDENQIAEALSKINDNLSYDDSRHLMEETYGNELSFFSIPIIGVNVYVQDVPLLGGFAISILMTWFYFARRREKGIIKEISQQVKELENKEKIKLIFYGVSLKAIFNTIDKLDIDSKAYLAKLSKFIIISLLFIPCLIIGIIQVRDTWENHVKGSKNQQYIILENGKYLYGKELSFYQNNFFIDDELITKNVCTYHYLNVLNNDKTGIFNVKWMKFELILLELVSLWFLIFSIIQCINIVKIINDEKKYTKIIADKFYKLN